MEKILCALRAFSVEDIVQEITGDATVSIVERKSREIRLRRTGEAGSGSDNDYVLCFSLSLSETLLKLRKKYFNLVIIDERQKDEAAGEFDLQQFLVPFLNAIELEPNVDKRYSSNRVLVLLDETPALAEQVFELGKLQIGSYLARPFQAGRLWNKVDQHLHAKRKSGKTAVCIAGGGAEGLLYELGVLKALNSLLANFRVTDFDIFCGISAGAYIAAVLANGVQPEELIKAFEGESQIFDPITSQTIYDLNYPEFFSTIISFWTNLAKSARVTPNIFASIIKAFPNGICKGEKLREFLKKQLETHKLSDDFRTLDKELYIGATNMDTFEHVVFGDTGWRDIPISTAVRASSAMEPIYSPARIGNTWYIDGVFTHTTNLELAIKKGATFVIVIDPIVPLKIDKPGYVISKGGIFSTIQVVKGLISTRFDRTYSFLKKRYPDVDFYVFKPKGEEMKLLSGSPMKYKIRLGIIKLAFETTLTRFNDDYDIFQQGFRKHGLELTQKDVPAEQGP